MGQLIPNDTLIEFTKLCHDQRAYAKQVIQYMLPMWPYFANGHWDRCTVQGVWMGQLVPNDTFIDFTKLHQDQRAYAKQVILYMLPIWPHFANGHWDRCTVQGVWIGQLVPNDSLNIWLYSIRMIYLPKMLQNLNKSRIPLSSPYENRQSFIYVQSYVCGQN